MARKLHPDVLKIDKSFTTAIGTDAVNSTVTDIIIALGQRLNIELVAEGVETEEQSRYLRRHSVHILQGTCMRGQCRCASFEMAGGKSLSASPSQRTHRALTAVTLDNVTLLHRAQSAL